MSSSASICPEAEVEPVALGKKARQAITTEIIAELTDCNTRLYGQRKKRQVNRVEYSSEAIHFHCMFLLPEGG
ncbi:unnamed protein product [Calypogeia fissa]